MYTKENIRDVVNFALERGVRVLPEFDAPAHVGEGWQDTGLTVCFNVSTWSYMVILRSWTELGVHYVPITRK